MNPYFLMGSFVAVMAAATAGYFKGYSAGESFIQQQWDNQMRQLAEDRAKEIELTREKEQNMQQAAENIRQEKDREIQEISARAATLSNSLRNRPERPERSSDKGAVSSSTPACSGASGAELARRDGEFLAGYSADAAKLSKALEVCEAQYAKVREELSRR
jgi:hypothetical protein